jgi:hypothetical protein
MKKEEPNKQKKLTEILILQDLKDIEGKICLLDRTD